MRCPPASLLSLLLATGCAAPLIRVAAPERAGAGPPTIAAAIDLGGLPLPPQGELSQDPTDERFTPGEWVALVGAGLHGATAVTVGDRAVPVGGYLQGGSLLVRVPRGLPPARHAVSVTTPLGTASATLPTSVYAYAGDTHGDAVRFRRQGPSSPRFDEAQPEVSLPRARFCALSRDGALLYAIQRPVHQDGSAPDIVNKALQLAGDLAGGAAQCALIVIHLGAKDEPQRVGGVTLALSSPPTGLATVGPQTLVVLQERQLTVLDLSDPLAPRPAATLVLCPPTGEAELVDAVSLDGGRWLAVLEAYANEVHLVDLQDPTRPARAGGVRLANAVGQPFSIDLAASGDGVSAWVLQGPNLRLAGQRLLDGLGEVGHDLARLEFAEALDSVGRTASGVVMGDDAARCRLVQVRLDAGALRIARSLPVPGDLFPFFVLPDGAGSLYVSGINRTVLELSRLEVSFDGLLALLDMLKQAVQLGRVVKINARSGAGVTVRQGVAIYYDLCLAPTGGLLTSTVRLGPGYLPPRVTLDWGLETDEQFAKLREVADSTLSLGDALERLLPPYDYERIGVQR